MNSPVPIRRALLGYRTRSVDRLVEEHRASVGRALEELRNQRIQAAELETEMAALRSELEGLRERSIVADALEGRIAELVGDLAGRDAELDGLRARLDARRPEPTEAPTDGSAGDHPHREGGPASEDDRNNEVGEVLREELKNVLLAAEQAATRIVGRAEETGRQRLQESQAALAAVEADARGLESWRDRFVPLAEDAVTTIDQTRVDAEEATARIGEQVQGLLGSLSTLRTILETLSGAVAPPPRRASRFGVRSSEAPTDEGVPDQNSPTDRVIDLTSDIEERWDHVYELFEPHGSAGPETF
jgi:hypothetical protein